MAEKASIWHSMSPKDPRPIHSGRVKVRKPLTKRSSERTDSPWRFCAMSLFDILNFNPMKLLYQDVPEGEKAGKRVAGRILFGVLVFAAALVGGMSGLLLVYSTDLPQVEE